VSQKIEKSINSEKQNEQRKYGGNRTWKPQFFSKKLESGKNKRANKKAKKKEQVCFLLV
jgi:hypothetical protein